MSLFIMVNLGAVAQFPTNETLGNISHCEWLTNV